MKLRSLLTAIAAAMLLASSCKGPGHYDVDRSEYPVKGIDVSAHNGPVDFDKARADSVEFVIIKATEGTEFCDAMFSLNFDRAKAAGLKAGAYHFFRFDDPGHLQAYHFLTAVSDKDVDLPLVIDVEDWRNAENVPAEEVVGQLRNMVDVVASAGYGVMIYTNKQGYDRYVRGNFDDVPLWLCALGGAPDDGTRWALWQHSHQGRVQGIRGSVDLNTYNGTRRDFDAWAGEE